MQIFREEILIFRQKRFSQPRGVRAKRLIAKGICNFEEITSDFKKMRCFIGKKLFLIGERLYLIGEERCLIRKRRFRAEKTILVIGKTMSDII